MDADIDKKTPIWLDCDTGHDDAFAVLVAAHSPDVRLLGISTVYGNAPLSRTTYNTLAILKAIGRENIAVYTGEEVPSKRGPCFAPGIHGESGLDGTTCLPQPTASARADMDAVEAMYAALSAQPAGQAWLVATGALTNVAALFARHPDLPDHLAGLSIMGGAVGGGFTDAPLGTVDNKERFGNHTPFAEFNIYCDPDAASAIFFNHALASKTTLIPLDLTHQFLATTDVRHGLLYGSDVASSKHGEHAPSSASIVRQLYHEIVQFFAHTYAEVFGITAGPPTHDPLAVFAAFRPDAFHYNKGSRRSSGADDSLEQFHVSVITDGEHGSSLDIRNGPSQCGRTVVRLLSPAETGVKIPRGADSGELWGLIESCLSRAERALHALEAAS